VNFLEKVDWRAYREEAVELLSELIQIDTSNPPGNETEAARYLQKKFAAEGITGEIIEAERGRGSFLARLEGGGAGPRLMLLSHTDVVPVADPARWEHPPFSGAVADGYLWGRGALDMKSQTIMEALVLFLFQRLKMKFNGELIYLAVADEERGADKGAGWLLREHPELLQVDYVLNEGGGTPLVVGGRTFYTIETVEKGLLWLKVRVKGRSGHASIPHGENALAQAATLIDRIARYRFPKQITETMEEFVMKVASPFGEPGERISQALLGPEEPDLQQLLVGTPLDPDAVNAFLRTTISPTMVQAGVKENVIPDSCEFVLDCRLLPSSSREEVMDKIKALAQELGMGIEMEILQFHPPSGSSVGTEFYKEIERALLAELPEAETVPFLLTGATDSRFLRELGATAYGFCPLSTEMEMSERLKLVHGDNERIDLESLELGTRIFARIAAAVLGAQG